MREPSPAFGMHRGTRNELATLKRGDRALPLRRSLGGRAHGQLSVPLQKFFDLGSSLDEVLHTTLTEIDVPKLDQFANLIDRGEFRHND